MNRKQQVNNILKAMSLELEEILNEPSLIELSPEECIGLAMEITINDLESEPTIKTHMPTGTIDRKKVVFMLDDTTAIPLFEGDEDDEDSIY